MIGFDDCAELDFASVSGFYAQLNAVLAGFAFAAIITLVTFRRAKAADRVDENITLAFVAAFIALIFGSLGYSILAGEPIPQARGRASAEELLLAGPFTLALMMLIYGLALATVRGSRGKAIVIVMSTLTVVIIPSAIMPLAMNSFAYSASVGQIIATPSVCANSIPLSEPEATLAFLTAPAALVALLLAAVLPFWRRWLGHVRWLPAVLVMAISLVATVLLGYVGGEPATFLFDYNVIHGMAVAFFVCVCLCSLIMAADVMNSNSIDPAEDQQPPQ